MRPTGRHAAPKHMLMRHVVNKVARLGGGCFLPADVEFTVMRTDAKGNPSETLRVFHFQARDLKANEKIPDSYFALPKQHSGER